MQGGAGDLLGSTGAVAIAYNDIRPQVRAGNADIARHRMAIDQYRHAEIGMGA
ncbi:hypothetical protein D3C77_797850 [compost metagenome]